MKRLLILSGKGGTGKTTTAAAFIRFAGAKAVADCDVDAPNLHLVTEISGTPDISDFLGGDKAVLDTEKCTGCGLCQAHCRFDAISRADGVYAMSEYASRAAGSAPMYVRGMPSAWLPTQPDERSFTRTAAYFPLPF